MGINGLWDVIGDGEVWHIADFATQHFEQHRRPLRIAVDAACWRFNNLTPEQVTTIREGEPAANPVEKTILWRLLRLLKLNIQPIFIDDGMRRPWKRNKRGGKVDYELTRLSHLLFDHLKVPHHRAPGEAEAECARLQSENVVDAVWSDDGDTLMFGCEVLIRQHKVNGKVVKDHIRVYRAQSIRERCDLDSESLVLFAILSGGDYNTGTSLHGCGPRTAALMAKRRHGLAHALCRASKNDLPAWRQMLQLTLARYGKSIQVPSTFPDWKALGHFRSPTVSTSEQLHNLRGLRQGWNRPIDQVELRVFLRDRFHIWTRGYLKHIAPIFLCRALAEATPEQRTENLAYGIELKRTRRKKAETEDASAQSERKITFSPLPTVHIDLGERPPEEDWTLWDGKDGTPYDPTKPVESEVLKCLLRHGLPAGILERDKEQSMPTNQKRGVEGEGSTSPPLSTKQQLTSNAKKDTNDMPFRTTAQQEVVHSSPHKVVRKKRGRQHVDAAAGLEAPYPATKKARKNKGEDGLQRAASPPPADFVLPTALPQLADLLKQRALKKCEDNTQLNDIPTKYTQLKDTQLMETQWNDIQFESRNDIVCTLEAGQNSRKLPSTSSPALSAQASPPPHKILLPGQVIEPQTLRSLRAMSNILSNPVRMDIESLPGVPDRLAPAPKRVIHEVIDLT